MAQDDGDEDGDDDDGDGDDDEGHDDGDGNDDGFQPMAQDDDLLLSLGLLFESQEQPTDSLNEYISLYKVFILPHYGSLPYKCSGAD